MIIYYNPKCSKCREALDLLEGAKCEVEIRNYLKDPPTKKELKELLKKLGIKAFDLVRTKEQFYKDNYEGKKLTNNQWIEILTNHPELIERPIVVDGEKAIIGRPPVLVLDLVKGKH
jgi:arsenate reductase